MQTQLQKWVIVSLSSIDYSYNYKISFNDNYYYNIRLMQIQLIKVNLLFNKVIDYIYNYSQLITIRNNYN